jgi:hypothetical protein
VQDYHRMGESGILAPNERTELIAGQILCMAAKGTPHVTALQLLGDRPLLHPSSNPLNVNSVKFL